MSEHILLQLLADMKAMKASHSEEMRALQLEMNTMKTSYLRSEEMQNGIIQGLRYDVDSIKVDLDLCSKRVDVLMARCSDNVNEIRSLRLEGKGLFRELEAGAKESEVLQQTLAKEEDARDFFVRRCDRIEREGSVALVVATSRTSVATAKTESIRKDLLGCHASLESARQEMKDSIASAKMGEWEATQQCRRLSDMIQLVHEQCHRHNPIFHSSISFIMSSTSCPRILRGVAAAAESWDIMFRCLAMQC